MRRSRPWRKDIATPRRHGLPRLRSRARRPSLRCARARWCFSSAMLSSSMARISTQEKALDVPGDRFARRLRRADLVADHRRVVRYDRVAPNGGSFRVAAPRLASLAVRVRGLHNRAILDRARHRPLRFAMSDVEAKSERGKSADLRVVSSAQSAARAIDPTNYQIAVELAEAAVKQAQANVQNADAQIAVQQAQVNASQAQVEQAKASLVFAQQQAVRYEDLAQKGYGPVQSAQQYSAEQREKQAAVETAEANLKLAQRQIDTLNAQRASAEASLAQANAQRDQARVNLKRTQIHSPVNGWVTNLLAQLGDYANVGQNKMTVVDADSFWVDAYFTETALGSIREGDPAKLKLMGHSDLVRGHVDSIARGINVPNAQAGPGGLATVNPIFT